jgi:hypothetical protein
MFTILKKESIIKKDEKRKSIHPPPSFGMLSHFLLYEDYNRNSIEKQ